MGLFKRKNKPVVEDIHYECYNLDFAFYKWLAAHLPIYLEDAGGIIKMDEYRFNIDGVDMTQAEIILEMIALANYIIKDESFFDKDLHIKQDRLLKLWAEVCPAMWW